MYKSSALGLNDLNRKTATTLDCNYTRLGVACFLVADDRAKFLREWPGAESGADRVLEQDKKTY
jgi:hypothetical protein